MHEASLMRDLMARVEAVAREHGARRVVRVKVVLGALSHFTAEHFREHFEHASAGTVAEGAALDIEAKTDLEDPRAQEVVLESAEIEEA